jgi:hypothetical protein
VKSLPVSSTGIQLVRSQAVGLFSLLMILRPSASRRKGFTVDTQVVYSNHSGSSVASQEMPFIAKVFLMFMALLSTLFQGQKYPDSPAYVWTDVCRFSHDNFTPIFYIPPLNPSFLGAYFFRNPFSFHPHTHFSR